jgi:hypothetical protein
MPDDDDLLPDVEQAILARLQAVVGKVQHPALSMSYFVADLDVLPDDETSSGMDEDDRIPDEERESARLRRAALLVAALDIVDRCMDDLQLLEFENGLPDSDYADESFVYQRFPVRHRGAYDEAFFRKVLVTAVKVAGDLANPDAGYASCTAEEIIRRAIGQDAIDLCDDAGLARPWADPDEYLLEDTDFEFLYSEDMDGVEDDPGAQAALGIEVSSIGDWFTPFNDGRHVHPYAETAPAAPKVHDLQLRLGAADLREVLAPGVIDAAGPVGSFAPGSEAVALARQAATTNDGRWVADDGDRERSFAAFVSATSADYGSGWLEWEPYDGADTVRTEPVVILRPHRHFPVGNDEPWAHASIGGGRMLAVPLRFVVSYRADPDVRKEWEQAFSNLP